MPLRIVVVGDVPAQDVERIRTVVASDHIDVRVAESGSVQELVGARPLPLGIVSYLPCTREAVLELIGRIPVGASKEVPVFQRIESDEPPSFLHTLPVYGTFCAPPREHDIRNMLMVMRRRAAAVDENGDLVSEVVKYRREKNLLVKIATALSSEINLDKLLEMILTESREAVWADAGSIYIRERSSGGGDRLTNRMLFKVAQNDSVYIAEKTREIPIPISDSTISGYVARKGVVLNVPDVYALDAGVPYRWQKGFDRRFGYRMKSMLTIPLKNLEGVVVGVLQLMNKKREWGARLVSPEAVDAEVEPFTKADEEMVLSIGALAAVTIERAQLYGSIEDIFEGFLHSSAAAIDERDRVTSGHSRRVAGYAIGFVDAVNACDEGPFAGVSFSEARRRQFKFAALLHDYGKIGVPEALLTKERRLNKGELSAIRARVELVKFLLATSDGSTGLPWASAEEIESDYAFIEKVDRAGFLPDDEYGRLERLRSTRYVDADGEMRPFLTDGEWESLSVRRGNLTAAQREIINSHAQATRRILSKIPWTSRLRRIPDIACHHHEKLDGSGYPDGLTGERIPLEARILAVVDIYEALVAQDRPYKPRMPAEKAVAILREEVSNGHLDGDVVEFFVEQNVYRMFLDDAGEGTGTPDRHENSVRA